MAPIARDIAMGGCVIEEKAVAHAQYLDLVYSQFDTLSELLPDAPQPSLDLVTSKSQAVPPVDGVMGLVS